MRNLRMILKSSFTIALMIMNAGCGSTRVIYVKHGEPVRLAESIKAKVWVLDKDGKPVKSMNKITIPEGWYTLPK